MILLIAYEKILLAIKELAHQRALQPDIIKITDLWIPPEQLGFLNPFPCLL